MMRPMSFRTLATATVLCSILAACGEDQAAQAPPTEQKPSPSAAQAPPAPAQPPAASSSELQSMIGRVYSAGPIKLQLTRDNAFIIESSAAQEKVTGLFSFLDGTLTFLDPQGEAVGARFPMKCRVEPVPNDGFRLLPVEADQANASCRPFREMTFTPQPE